ncbi:odhI, partial [Symbiodinium sp. CCMP2456]
MATLRLVQGVEPGKRFPLTAERSTIGRSSDCEVSLDVAAVSRRHAEVIRRGADFVVEDLGSRNGTYVKLAALIEIAKGLGRAISIDEVLPKLLDSLFKVFTQADRGFVVMRPAPDAPLVPVAAKTRRGDMEEGARISRTIVEEAMTGKKAILSADAASDERFGMAESIAQFQIRSMMCVPLIDSEDEPMGVIQIDTLNQ